MSSSSRKRRAPKRYVLFMADSDLTEADRARLGEILEKRYGGMKVIPVNGNPRAVVVKTTNLGAPMLRDLDPRLTVGGKELVPTLTSGAIGKLKRRAAPAAANGQVHER